MDGPTTLTAVVVAPAIWELSGGIGGNDGIGNHKKSVLPEL